MTAQKNPLLSITKVAAESTYDSVGDILNYTITATNIGNVTLASVTVSDPLVSGLNCTPANGSSLAPGESIVCTATHTVSQADLDAGHWANTACVDDGPLGAPQVCDDEDVPGDQKPQLSIMKVATEASYAKMGDVLHYTITAKNTGNVTLASVTVSDAAVSGMTCTPTNGSTLAPGQSMVCTATHTVIQDDLDAGHWANTACVDDGPEGAPQVCDTEDVPLVRMSLDKYTNGVLNNTMAWSFKLTGPGLPEGGVSINTPPPTGLFASYPLLPGETYTVCEAGIPSTYTNVFHIDPLGGTTYEMVPFLAGVNNAPILPGRIYSSAYDPYYVPYPAAYANDTRCVKFIAQPRVTVAFKVDNNHPGGDARTIGYWKNWSTCSGGGQAEKAAANGGAAEGWWLIDDVLKNSIMVGDVPVVIGITIGDLQMINDGTISNCPWAVAIMDKRDIVTGKKQASDPLFNLASQLTAAVANKVAGAGMCAAAQSAIEEGQALLAQLDFDGTAKHKAPSKAQITRANTLASTLDKYNNNMLCN